MSLKVTRLAPALGARVEGVDLSRELDDATFAEIRSALNDADGVLVFPGQKLTPAQQIAFSSRFGPLERLDTRVVGDALLPGHPEVFLISNKVEGGRKVGYVAGTFWHSDLSYKPEPAVVSLLYARELPDCGGDTLFASMYRAHEGLSAFMQQYLDKLDAVHDYRSSLVGKRRDRKVTGADDENAYRATHPAVRTHPETGRKSLFVNEGFTSYLQDVPAHESDAVLAFLFRHSVQQECLYRHRWSPDDLVIWDNRCVIHYAVTDYSGVRHMHRTSVLGDKVVR